MSNWNNNGRYHGGFPRAVHRQAERELDYRCAHCTRDDTRLWLDHIINKAAGGSDSLDNAQWLCGPCHDTKTKAEAAHARWGRRTRTPRQHPSTAT